MAGVSLDCGPLLTPVEEAPDLSSLSDVSDSAACGTPRRSTPEIDLDSERIEHTETEDQIAKVGRQMSSEVAKVDLDVDQLVSASSSNTPEGNSNLEAATNLNDPDISEMTLGMGKRVKTKSCAPPKEKQAVVSSPKTAADQSNASKSCPHLAKGFDLKALSEKIGSSGPDKCQDCREGAADRRGKGKGKHGKKKGKGSANASTAIWVCLQCGHYGCGGVGLPGTQHHAFRHHRQARHPLVIQWKNSQLRWCFQCDKFFPFERTDENGDKRDALLDVVKLMKPSPEKKSVDVEDILFRGGGSVVADVATDYALPSNVETADGYLVRGLTNLGNTCFFNSVMQNLLAMDSLRDYFLKKDASFGPLSMALKKLFCETRTDTGLRNVINPRPLFGSVCSKAPQFRGYQQQDSHELLRCLLDGLSTEELAAKKQLSASDESKNSAVHSPTFVDSSFGGGISSTVSCLECGHSSTVFEPFLDLSLPVPTKKPPAKRVPATKAKKTKLPPKRGSRIKPKAYKDTDAGLTRSVSEPSVGLESHEEKSGVSLGESAPTSLVDNATGSSVTLDEISMDAEALPALPKSDNEHCATAMEQTADSCYEYSWMDFVGPGLSGSGDGEDDDFASQSNDFAACPYSADENVVLDISLVDDNQVCSASKESDCNQMPGSSLNPSEEEVPRQVSSSEVLLLPYKEESFAGGDTKEEADASSSVIGNTQENGDFDGLGDLFNEPEVSSEPIAGPSLMATNGSDSDPNEVDDTDSPVSVGSCLLHFIKPELLINDNAWECDNCSSKVKRQVLKKERMHSESTSGTSTVYESCDQDDSFPPALKFGVDEPCSNGEVTSNDQNSGCQAIENCESKGSGDRTTEKPSKQINVKRDATKRVLIDKAPLILTIHLKRFSQDARGRLTKLNGHVNFGETLDLRPYMDPRCTGEDQYVYRLLGVVEHMGTMRGGHYVAYVRGEKRKSKAEGGSKVWYHASDMHVREVSFEEVLRSEAYILFYERV